MKYLKKLNSKKDYVDAIKDLDRPHICLVDESLTIFITKPSFIVGKYRASENSNTIQVITSDESISIDTIERMKVDGVEVTPSKTIEVNDKDIHTIELEINENVRIFDDFFNSVSNLVEVNLDKVSLPITSIQGMFAGCAELQHVNIGKFNTKYTTNMYGIFTKCSKLKSIDLSTLQVDSVEDMGGMFKNCSQLNSINWGEDKIYPMLQNARQILYGCAFEEITNNDIFGEGAELPELTIFQGAFQKNNVCTSIEISNISIPQLENISAMCAHMPNLETMAWKVETPMCQNFSQLFYVDSGVEPKLSLVIFTSQLLVEPNVDMILGNHPDSSGQIMAAHKDEGFVDVLGNAFEAKQWTYESF